jgi:hypothetical protein
MPHARAEENVAQRDIFLKSSRATVPGTQQIITRASVQIHLQVVIDQSA